MTIPRHLVDLTTLMTTLLIVSAYIGPMNTDLCNNIASHFTGCNTIAFIMHHSAMRASALFVTAIAVSTSSAMQYKIVSSAYISDATRYNIVANNTQQCCNVLRPFICALDKANLKTRSAIQLL